MKRRFEKIHLKWKIFGFQLIFCALLLVVLWLFQTVFLKDMYKWVRTQEMAKAIKTVEKNIDSEDLPSIFQTLLSEKEIRVTYADKGSSQDPSPSQRQGGDHGKPKQETLTKTHDFMKKDGSLISYTFHAVITPVNATVSTLNIQLYFITVILLLLSVLLAFLIARHVSKPMEEITKSAKALASGLYDTNFDGRGFLEIRELSETLNTAALELSKTEALRRELMANISHDLRTPLSLIYSYAEVMHDFPLEITSSQTQTIMDETKRLSSLVNDVFDISRLETGDQTLHTSTFNLTASIASTISRMEELLKREGYSFAFQYEEDAFLCGDQVKIAQVFYNLLINAVNYSDRQKHIVISQILSPFSVRIEITDQGDGITPDDLPYIWDRYYKADKSHKRAITGSGLGLSIVKGIVELHNGTYGVESVPGEGSTFWFCLPM